MGTGYAGGVAVSGNYAYLSAGGLHVIDISDPGNPRPVGGYDVDGGWRGGVAVFGEYVYHLRSVVGLKVLDIRAPANPKCVAEYGAGQDYHDIPVVVVLGDQAYLSRNDGYVEVLNVRRPTHPAVGRYSYHGRLCFPGGMPGNYAYISPGGRASARTLELIDIRDPAHLRSVGGVNACDQTRDVAVSGRYAYLVERDAGLQVIDVAEPANPTRVGRYATTGTPSSVAVDGHTAYLAGQAGLEIVNVRDPVQPQRVAFLAGACSDLVLSNPYAYLASWGAGLRVVDIRRPASPVQVGECRRAEARRLWPCGVTTSMSRRGTGGWM